MAHVAREDNSLLADMEAFANAQKPTTVDPGKLLPTESGDPR